MAKKTALISSQCVACGCCENVCPLHAISVWNGIKAKVNTDICVGCGKCEKVCPASVITIMEREGK